MLRPPTGETGLEISRFIRPDHEAGTPAAMANTLGLRNVMFEVDDLRGVLDRLAAAAIASSGASASTKASGSWRMCAVPKGSSWRWRNESADPLPSMRCCSCRSGAAGRGRPTRQVVVVAAVRPAAAVASCRLVAQTLAE